MTEWSVSAAPARYAHIATEMGEADVVTGLRKLNRDVGIPVLRGLDIPEQRYRSLLEKMSVDALASGSPANNPRDASAAQIVELYHKAYAETAWA